MRKTTKIKLALLTSMFVVSAGGRVGARRTESAGERPVGLGASFTADRLSVDYGVNLFEGNTAAHYITVRWR